MTQWVQHISRQGAKWSVHKETFASSGDAWCVMKPLGGYHYIPKSEYIPCDPPNQWEDVTGEWEDVTGECEVSRRGDDIEHRGNLIKGYRLRKVEVNRVGPGILNGCQKQWAFIVEKGKS